MKYSMLFLLLVITTLDSHSQRKLNRDPQFIVDRSGIMRVLTPPTQVEGTANMFEDWQPAEVYLNQGKNAAQLEVNYDIYNHIVNVRFQGKEYSLNPIAVDSLHLVNLSQTLVNTNLLQGLQGDALLLKVYDGPHVALYRKTLVEIIKPNYNELLNVGSRNYQIDQDIFHYLADKSSEKYYQLKGKKKDFKELANADRINSFIKKQNLNLKNEADLVEVVKYYEELTF